MLESPARRCRFELWVEKPQTPSDSIDPHDELSSPTPSPTPYTRSPHLHRKLSDPELTFMYTIEETSIPLSPLSWYIRNAADIF